MSVEETALVFLCYPAPWQNYKYAEGEWNIDANLLRQWLAGKLQVGSGMCDEGRR
jgi:hypothetical protein